MTPASPEDIGFEHAPIGLIVARHRVIERCNARFCAMFDFSKVQLEGQSLSMLYPSANEFEAIGDRGMQRMREHGSYNDERIMRKRGGELFWCRVRGQSLDQQEPFAHTVWSMAELSTQRPTAVLSARERQVAMLLLEGKTSKELGRQLGISPRTVDAHRARLLRKFQAKNATELIARLAGLPDFKRG